MSCRHDLALGTCKVCYPETGTTQPDGEGESLDGPGAVDREGNRLPLPMILNKPEEEGFTPPDFEFQGVRFTWNNSRHLDYEYEPVDPPTSDLNMYIDFQWVELKPGAKTDPKAVISGNSVVEYQVLISAPLDYNDPKYDFYNSLTGEGSNQTPQEAIRSALEDLAHRLEERARMFLNYSERVEARALSGKWLPIGDPPTWET